MRGTMVELGNFQKYNNNFSILGVAVGLIKSRLSSAVIVIFNECDLKPALTKNTLVSVISVKSIPILQRKLVEYEKSFILPLL